jgi:hypothetical protein
MTSDSGRPRSVTPCPRFETAGGQVGGHRVGQPGGHPVARPGSGPASPVHGCTRPPLPPSARSAGPPMHNHTPAYPEAMHNHASPDRITMRPAPATRHGRPGSSAPARHSGPGPASKPDLTHRSSTGATGRGGNPRRELHPQSDCHIWRTPRYAFPVGDPIRWDSGPDLHH